MDNNKHFTEKKYVVYKRRVAWHQYYTDRVEEVARDLSYTKALNMVNFQLTRYNDELPLDVARRLYSYVEQDEFDKYQDDLKKQLTICELDAPGIKVNEDYSDFNMECN